MTDKKTSKDGWYLFPGALDREQSPFLYYLACVGNCSAPFLYKEGLGEVLLEKVPQHPFYKGEPEQLRL